MVGFQLMVAQDNIGIKPIVTDGILKHNISSYCINCSYAGEKKLLYLRCKYINLLVDIQTCLEPSETFSYPTLCFLTYQLDTAVCVQWVFFSKIIQFPASNQINHAITIPHLVRTCFIIRRQKAKKTSMIGIKLLACKLVQNGSEQLIYYVWRAYNNE